MAVTDLIGVVSLLIAAAGAAYLLWDKYARAPLEAPARRARAADTIPPVLRPEADMPKKLKGPSAPPKPASVPPDAGPSAPPKAPSAPPAAAEAAAAEGARAKSAPPPAKGASAPPPSKPSKKPPPEVKIAIGTSGPAAAEPFSRSPSSLPPRTRTKVSVPPAPRVISEDDVAPRAAIDAGVTSTNELGLPRLDVEEDEELQPTRVGRIERGSIRPAVDKIVFDEGADIEEPPVMPPKIGIYAVAQTHTGKRRKHNEDSFLVIDEDAVYVVADGMGGHRGGEYASKLAVKTIGSAFADKIFKAEAHADIPQFASELARAIQMANTAIQEEAKRRPQLTGMGTTLCAIRFSADRSRMFVGHVGDSRCYRLRDGVMKQMTTDHTMAGYGVAGPEGAHLSRAVGVWPTVPIDIVFATPQIGDVYLLCSDGLTKMIPDGTIATQLAHEEDPKVAVERLVFFANSHGGKDNITVIVVRIVEPGWTPPARE